MTNHQRDQRFQKTLLPDDSQLTARTYEILWSCHRKNMIIAHGWRKEFKNERNWNLKRNLNFEKEINLAWIILHNRNWFQINELDMLIFYKWLFTILFDKNYWEWSLLTRLSSSLSLIFTFFVYIEKLRRYKIWTKEWLEVESLYFLGWKFYWIWCKAYWTMLYLLRY